jgi:serine/threonine protein kinase
VPNLESDEWKYISSQAKDFLSKALDKDPTKRINAK